MCDGVQDGSNSSGNFSFRVTALETLQDSVDLTSARRRSRCQIVSQMGRSPMRDGAMGMGTSDQTSQLSLALGLYGFIAFTVK